MEPHIAEQDCELVEVVFGQSGRQSVLRLFIDKKGGMGLDDCAAISQMLGPVLDAADFIEGSYLLEVSSPGIDRPVRKPGDFERFAGESIRLHTVAPVDGRKKFRGMLRGFRDGVILLEQEGTPYRIHIGNLEKANLDR